MPFTPKLMREGRARLASLLPRAQNSKLEEITSEFMSEVLKVTVSHLRVDNFDALVISRAEKGGWSIDLVLKDVPFGVSNMIGTPVRSPMRTRELAEAHACDFLAGILRFCEIGREKPVDYVVFEYFRFVFKFPYDGIQKLSQILKAANYTSENRLERLDEITSELFPADVVPDEAMERLSPDDMARLRAVLATALSVGLFRYPDVESKPPPPETHSTVMPDPGNPD